MSASLTCRSCGAVLDEVVLDLGEQPLANSYVVPGEEASERRYPLCARLCTTCGLVQVGDFVAPEAIFSDYAYFSSYSDSWVAQARRYATAAANRFELKPGSTVVELASNDGYLLQHFLSDGMNVVGVEPAANVAAVAQANGIETMVSFFGESLANDMVACGTTADLLVANNVLAHVPDLNDFVAGIERVLSPRGVATIEVPHLLTLVEQTQFDTIYHEHFSYFSLFAAQAVLARHGLTAFDAEELATHGGSLRIFACRADDPAQTLAPTVANILERERKAQLTEPAGFEGFASRVRDCCEGLTDFLEWAAEAHATVAAYGAAAKGNTLLNASAVTTDSVAYVVDRNPHKQGLLLPGSHLPIHDPSHLLSDRPAYVLILPWNLRDEIVEQMSEIRRWGGRFVTAVPEIVIA